MTGGPRHRRSVSVTIRDVARISGVSPATVTRALRGYPLVRPETRLRVETAAAQLGYRPDSIAQALATRTTQTVGVLVPSSGDSFWGEVAAAIEERAAEAGFSVLLANAHGDAERERRAVGLFLSRRVDGIIVASTPSGTEQWFAAGRLPDLPIVRINWDIAFGPDLVAAARRSPVDKVARLIEQASSTSPFEEIGFDDMRAGADVVEHLVALGHRRIAFVGLTPIRPALLRYLGVRLALEQAGLQAGPTVECRGTLEASRAAAGRAMAGRWPPTAIVAYDDITAIGVMRGLHAMGRIVPGDVSVIGFDDIEVAAFVEPPLTTVRQPKAQMGRLAMDAVLSHLETTSEPGVHSLVGEIVVRMSSGPIGGR
jgi:DNA-binding LacI/PurR family transcriptional regulator